MDTVLFPTRTLIRFPGDGRLKVLDAVGARYLAACSTGTRMSKLLLNRAPDQDFAAILADCESLQKRAQYSLDAASASRAHREGKKAHWRQAHARLHCALHRFKNRFVVFCVG